MTMDIRRAQLWQAMGLGPIYRLRSATVRTPTEAASAPPVADRAATIARLEWKELRQEVASCRACSLCETRKQTVFGVGNINAEWMLIGEAPGAEEDARGEPFVGQAGRLLDNMLASIGMSREGQTPKSVYIANVLKCRPPGNRNPQPDEVSRCEPFLLRQIELVHPALIVVMGRFAAQSLLGTDASIASLRGKPHRISVAGRQIPVVVTYHPAYLLRNLIDKEKSWADLCLARKVHNAG
jgi:uracil-DNA glycosylase family 4